MNQTRTFLLFAWLVVATLLFMAWGRDKAMPEAATGATTTYAPGGSVGRRWRNSSRNWRLIRLRPTAFGSTLRETARPRRAGCASRSQCRLKAGLAWRRPPSKTRPYSAGARTRAAGGKLCWEGIGRRLRPRGSGAEALATLGTTTGQDLAAIGGLHAGTEAVVALALEVAGLVGALGGHGGIRCLTDRKDWKF